MKVGILGKLDKVESVEIIEEMQTFLQELGYETVRFSSHTEIEGVDVVLVLGGDGTILHAAVPAAQKGIKLIGINYGTLGFLTEYEKNERTRVQELLSAVKEGTCRIVKRSLLEVTIRDRVFYALNEIAVQRDTSLNSTLSTQILRLEFSAQEGKEMIDGDGLLICTPTGSTAYSLSAGGAILTPEVPVFMMTPICAFSMRSRPIVFSNEDEFAVRIQKGNGIILLDGKVVASLPEGGEIQVKKAPFTANFPVQEGSDFFARIKNKLNG
ncbi:MAG: NAD(+)/NADH kinase [Clostridia bacterium]|nr:NAD(+)/NADH kinase [Clostridia bacterium]